MQGISAVSLKNFISSTSSTKVSGKATDGSTETFDKTLDNFRTSEDTSKNSLTKETKSDDVEGEDKTNLAKLNKSATKDKIKQEKEPTDEQMAAISDEIVKQIKDVIKEQFSLTDEELAVVMNDSGMTDMDLLDTNSLTNLVMQLDNVEQPSDILTHLDFANDLKVVMENFKDISKTVPAQMLEDFKNVEEVNVNPVEIADMNVEFEAEESDDEPIINQIADEFVETEEVIDTKNQGKENPVTVEMSENSIEAINEINQQVATEKNYDDNDSKSDSDESDKAEVTPKNDYMVNQHEFAARLTEDLTEKVGERQALDIVRQVTDQVHVQNKQGVKSMELQLYPEHLGKVLVQVVSKNGTVTAQLAAETETARHALESQVATLKENLENQGIKVAEVEVTIASHEFEQNMQGERQNESGNGSSNRNRRGSRILSEMFSEEEPSESDVMEVRGNTVSYSA